MAHYTPHNAGEGMPVGGGWVQHTCVLGPADTAYLPGTTKRMYRGPGTITYHVHPTQVVATPSPTITTTAR